MRLEVIGISNDEDYRAARQLVSSLMDSESAENVERLRAQAILVAAWERSKSPPLPPEAIEAIRFRMEQMGLKPKDMVPAFGTRSRVTEVLNRERKLSLAMIRRLHSMYGIPLDLLIREGRGGSGRQRTRSKTRKKQKPAWRAVGGPRAA